MRLGRFLGQYDRPILVAGTSWLIEVGQHSYGALSSFAQASYQALSDKNHGYRIAAKPETGVLRTTAREYQLFYDNRVLDNHRIPKASHSIISALRPIELPPEIRDMIAPSLRLWQTLPHAYGEWLDAADLELITFVHEQAKNGRECYVFTYDKDEADTVKKLEADYPSVHLAEESLQCPDELVHLLGRGTHSKPILMHPWAIGELYGMPASTSPTHYLLTAANAPFAGSHAEIGISIHHIEGKINQEEGGAARYPLLIADTEKLYDAIGTPTFDAARRRVNAAFSHAIGALNKVSDIRVSPLIVEKSLKHGSMIMQRLDRRAVFVGGHMTVVYGDADMMWLKISDGYLRRFFPETLEYTREFKRRFPK